MSTKHHSLYFLLALFAAAALAILAYELSGTHVVMPEDPSAVRPRTPGEFPEVFAFDPLKGLDKGVGDIHVPPPPLSADYWPCADCHDPEDDNRERRVLVDEHEDIELRHDEENRWCLDCHDFEKRNRLRLASGELISFAESYRLCGQCHGTIYRDWRAGIHGRRSGFWDGPKRYLLCVHCHWPHAPRFEPMQPMPAPVRPEFIGLGLLQDAAVASKEEDGAVSGGEGAKQ